MSANEGMMNFFDKKIQEGIGEQRGSLVAPRTQEDAIRNRELFYERLGELGMNIEEIQPVLEDYGNLLIESCAGAGKTTLIVLKLHYDMLTGADLKVVTYNTDQGVQQEIVKKRILVSTFLNTGAKELQESFYEWGRKIGIQGVSAGNITFKTIHAEIKGALTDMGVPTPITTKTQAIIKKLMVELNIRNVQAKGFNPTVDEMRDVSGILAYARNMLGPERYQHHLMGDYRMTDLVLDLFIKKYKEELQASYSYDYEYLQETLLEGMQMNPNAVEFISNRYDMVIVDEFQDTSQLQYEILKAYFRGKQVIVVGDSDQAIYSFRGADIKIILSKFLNDYNPTVRNLTYNYRCRSVILNAVKTSIERNTLRNVKELRAAHEGGNITLVKDKDVTRLVKAIEADMQENRTVGVLARMNVDLLMPAILLEIEDKYDYALSKGVSIESRLPKQIIGLMELVTKRYAQGFKGHLESLLPRQLQREAQGLAQVLSINPSMDIYTMELLDLKQSYPNLHPILNNLRIMKEQRGDKDAYLYLLDYMKHEMFTSATSTYAKNARDFITFMEELISTHPKLQEMTLESIYHMFTASLPTRMASRQTYQGKSIIKLTTIHEAKGKEWDTSIMWNVVDGTYPAEIPNHTMTESELEEERRIFYIGATRGKDHLMIFTEYGRESMYLAECDFSQLGIPSALPEGEVKIFDTAGVDTEAVRSTAVTAHDMIEHYVTAVQATVPVSEPRHINLSITLQQYTTWDLVAQLTEYRANGAPTQHTDITLILDEFFEHVANKTYGTLNSQ